MSSEARLWVALASSAEPALLDACLASIEAARERMARPANVVVARSATASDASALFADRPWASLVVVPGTPNVPELRGQAMSEAGNGWVVLTEDIFLASPDWLAELEALEKDGEDVIGGAIGNARKSALSHAAYLTDYGDFAPHRPAEANVDAISGSNVAYSPTLRDEARRWALAGAWEHIIHDRLADAGARLRFEPSVRVDHNATYRFGDVLAVRYDHGLNFAQDRLQERAVRGRLLRILLAPVLPFVLTLRVAARSATRDFGAFLGALPLVFALLTAWVAGETVGYIRGGDPSI